MPLALCPAPQRFVFADLKIASAVLRTAGPSSFGRLRFLRHAQRCAVRDAQAVSSARRIWRRVWPLLSVFYRARLWDRPTMYGATITVPPTDSVSRRRMPLFDARAIRSTDFDDSSSSGSSSRFDGPRVRENSRRI